MKTSLLQILVLESGGKRLRGQLVEILDGDRRSYAAELTPMQADGEFPVLFPMPFATEPQGALLQMLAEMQRRLL